MHNSWCFSVFLFKNHFLSLQILTCSYLSKQKLILNFRIADLPISVKKKKNVLEVQSKDSGCFGPIFLRAWFKQNCSTVGSDL